jgi:hypothetical protein
LNNDQFMKIEEFMLVCMKDCAHDKDHPVMHMEWMNFLR